MPTYDGGDRAHPHHDVLVAHDATMLGYHMLGEGAPVICLPGGPMQDSAYLGDLGDLGGLGGLSGRLQLILFDYRGTGRRSHPQTPFPSAATGS